jgi:hypothetical protein
MTLGNAIKDSDEPNQVGRQIQEQAIQAREDEQQQQQPFMQASW